jgi:excinuclease ABC subunit A
MNLRKRSGSQGEITRSGSSSTGSLKPGIRRRLELSVKAAIELAEGLVTVAALDLEERLFSERQACIDCGISVPALEPRSFSFNSRHGACPECEGMGTRMVINPDNTILDPSQPVSLVKFPVEDGRIADYLHEALLRVVQQSRIDVKTPFERLPLRVRNTYFFGTSDPAADAPAGSGNRGEFPGIGDWLRSP